MSKIAKWMYIKYGLLSILAICIFFLLEKTTRNSVAILLGVGILCSALYDIFLYRKSKKNSTAKK